MAGPAWLLDTNALSELIRNPRGPLVERLDAIDPDTLCTSIVVACELRFGARRKGSDVLTRRVDQLLDTLTVLALGAPAHARSLDLTLVTRNTREFERVPGLRVEDWLAARS